MTVKEYKQLKGLHGWQLFVFYLTCKESIKYIVGVFLLIIAILIIVPDLADRIREYIIGRLL